MTPPLAELFERVLERDALLSVFTISSTRERAEFVARIGRLAPQLDRLLTNLSPSLLEAARDQAEQEIALAIPLVAEILSDPMFADTAVRAIAAASPPSPPARPSGPGVDDFRELASELEFILPQGDSESLARRLHGTTPAARTELWTSLLQQVQNSPQTTPSKNVRRALSHLGPIGLMPSQLSSPAPVRQRHSNSPVPPPFRSSSPFPIAKDSVEPPNVEPPSNDVAQIVRSVVLEFQRGLREDILERTREQHQGLVVALQDLQRRLGDSEREMRDLSSEVHNVRENQARSEGLCEEQARLSSRQQATEQLVDKLVQEFSNKTREFASLRSSVSAVEQALATRLDEVPLPIAVYIKDKDVGEAKGRELLEAAANYAKAHGFEPEDLSKVPFRTGSFSARAKAVWKALAGRDGIEGKLQKVEEGLEAHFIRAPGAQAGLQEAEATSKLMAALKEYKEAIVAVGPAIVVKQTLNGEAQMFVVPLVEKVRRRINEDPGCLTSPNAFFAMLASFQESQIRALDPSEARLALPIPKSEQ